MKESGKDLAKDHSSESTEKGKSNEGGSPQANVVKTKSCSKQADLDKSQGMKFDFLNFFF